MSAYDDQSMGYAIEAIYGAALDPARWGEAVAAFGQAVQGESRLVVFDGKRQNVPYIATSGLDPALERSLLDRYLVLNPYVAAYAGLPVGKIIWSHDVVDPDEVKKTEFYDGFMRPAGIRLDFPGIKLIQHGDCYAGLASNPRAQFSDVQRDWYESRFLTLSRHATRALEINRLAGTSKYAEASLEQSLNAMAGAAFVLDGARRLMLTNAKGELLLCRERLFLSERGREFRAWRPDDDSRLALYLMAEAKSATFPLKLRSGGSDRSFMVWRVPLRVAREPERQEPHSVLEALMPRAETLLLAMPIDKTRSIRAEFIRETLGLTLAESRLVSAIAGGRTVAQYADDAGISERTVRNQLGSIYQKTGTSGQSELMVLVTGTLAHISDRL